MTVLPGSDTPTVPPQGQRGEPTADPRDQAAPADPLEQPDAYAAADAAGVEGLLRCWAREAALAAPQDGTLRVPLPASGTTLLVPVRHWSAVGHHRFGTARFEAGGPPADAVTVAALIAREAAAGAVAVSPDGADLVGRVADSVRRTAVFIAERRAEPGAPAGTHPFLDAEQALILGHSLHPTPKGREGLTEAEARDYSPELRGSFPLHWLAVDRRVLATDSAWTERGRPIGADQLLAGLAGPGLRLPEGTAPLPLHPWQADDIRNRPEVRELFDAGLLHDLGPAGDPWHPTSSVRTVYRPDALAMLKLSLGLRITNSRRENLRKELQRGTEVHRLLRSGLAEQWHAAHPGFDIVRDPAWLAVDTTGGEPVQGLDVVLRHNPFGPGDDAACVAGLTSPAPGPARRATPCAPASPSSSPASRPAPDAPRPPYPPSGSCAISKRSSSPSSGSTAWPASPSRRTSRTRWSSSTPTAGRAAAATATTRATTSASPTAKPSTAAFPVSARTATPSSPTPSPTSASPTTSASTTSSA